MRISTSKMLPTTNELLEDLKREFPNQYSYSLFGKGKEKSIIVRKSKFNGVEISKVGNEIATDAYLFNH